MSDSRETELDEPSADEYDFDDDDDLYELVERLDASTVVSPPPEFGKRPSDFDDPSSEEHDENLCPAAEIDTAKLDPNVVKNLDVTRSEAGVSPYERFRARRSRLSVTDLVAPLWCNTQFQYNLELLAQGGRKRRTKAMKVGSAIHSSLEAEVHVTVEFEIDPERPEERFGLRLLNMIAGLSELMQAGITREFPVFGRLREYLVTGVIDELRLSRTAQKQPKSHESQIMSQFLGKHTSHEESVLTIGDTKTRVSRSPPSDIQAEQAKLQLSLYWTLFRKLSDFPIEALLAIEKVDGNKILSDVFISQAYDVVGDALDSDSREHALAHTVLGYWKLLTRRARELSKHLSSHMEITYIHQRSKEPIAVTSFEHDEAWMNEHIESVFAWWTGSLDARGVSIEETFKCRSCEFENGCSWRMQKVAELATKREQEKSRSTANLR